MRLLPALVFAAIVPAIAANTPKKLRLRSDCHSGVYVLTARGTSEPQGHSVLDAIAQAIVAAIPDSASAEVIYPATLDFVSSVPIGVVNFTRIVNDYAAQCPNGKIVAIGYSQGAVVTEVSLAGTDLSNLNYTSEISSDTGKQVAAIIQYGDPTRVPDQGVNALGSSGCNATSPLPRDGAYKDVMATYADRLLDWCNFDDPVCCKTGKTPAAHESYFTDENKDTVVNYVKQKVGSSSPSASGKPSASQPSSSASASASVASRSSPSPTQSATSSASVASSAPTSSPTGSGGRPEPISASLTVRMVFGMLACLYLV